MFESPRIREPKELKKIKVLRKELAKEIRKFCLSQKELWQKVPYLSLEADGRTGHSDTKCIAFCCGLGRIESSISGGFYTVFIDLETGELVNSFNQKISDELLLKLDVDELNASALIKRLEKEAQTPIANYYNEAEKETWRKSVREELKLNPRTYKRVNKVGQGTVFLGLPPNIS